MLMEKVELKKPLKKALTFLLSKGKNVWKLKKYEKPYYTFPLGQR